MKTYLVGGAVRDLLLGLESNDRDFVVVGATEQMMDDAGFSNIGAAFPVFLHPVTREEYALARREKKTGPGHTGFAVEFGAEVTLVEDLSRRDLTVNAMAMDLSTGEIIDPFGGKKDLDNFVLRHVSRAFSEDPLRVVRIARFFAKMPYFSIAAETLLLCREVVDSGEMDTLSNERFWAELEKVFKQEADVQRFFDALHSFGALEKVKFFKDTFGKLKTKDYQVDFEGALKFLSGKPEDKMTVFVSVIAGRKAPQMGTAMPWRIKKLTLNLGALEDSDGTAESLYDLLLSNRGWGTEVSRSFQDLLDAVLVLEKMQKDLAFGSHVMALFSDGGCMINAEEFMHLPGKQIGESIKARRVKLAEKLLKEQNES